jgi:uncharacterized small protein (DUF1192 family)
MVTKRSVISQLASVGEGALERLTQNPVAHKALEGALQVKDRVEKLVNGLAEVEERVARLEERVDRLEPKRPPAKRSGPKRGDEPEPAASPEPALSSEQAPG